MGFVAAIFNRFPALGDAAVEAKVQRVASATAYSDPEASREVRFQGVGHLPLLAPLAVRTNPLHLPAGARLQNVDQFAWPRY